MKQHSSGSMEETRIKKELLLGEVGYERTAYMKSDEENGERLKVKTVQETKKLHQKTWDMSRELEGQNNAGGSFIDQTMHEAT